MFAWLDQERMEALVYHSEPLICEEHVKSHGTIEHCIEIKASSSCLQLNLNDPEIDENFNSNKLLERAVMQFGCQHYRRRCRIQAPCCNEVFDCRDCHNEAQNSINVESVHRHNLPRHEVQNVICSLCGTEQMIQQVCIHCGVSMGRYFCETCKLFDDDTAKKLNNTTAMAVESAGCCYSNILKTSHPCIEWALLHDCPYLFESTNDVSVLPCGHTIHVNCFEGNATTLTVWEKLDIVIAATPMPESYHNLMVHILCNDCGVNSDVKFHIVAQKCLNCKSYKTPPDRKTCRHSFHNL
ncbi:probable E3 ubiquitin-protein ligase RZFP34 [Dioscorea cayenensis subsp. rotundata]|uniref:Probable E3 ubiquitin-protein ligase RZFP34 n=1 Tax=Dioscorea cayennensis subsp. rotundata TaxID=55577 RepID=A0AB40BC76_DIOCR|nr:probable E3 ubiquitin-protein ligase RZFP34 [Dioscorea cayenensis subsp. rotundata]